MTAPAPELLDLARAIARLGESEELARSQRGVEHAKKRTPGRR